MDKAILDWGEERFRREVKRVANELADSFVGEINMENINADIIFEILTRRLLKDIPDTYEEIGQKYNLGMKTLQKILYRAEEKILDKNSVAESFLKIRRRYCELVKKYQTAQHRLKKKTQSV